MTDANETPEEVLAAVEAPEVDVLEVVNTIPVAQLDKASDDRERVGVYLAMADAAFARLIAYGGHPDTVSMAIGRGTRDTDGEAVAVATFRAFRPAAHEDNSEE